MKKENKIKAELDVHLDETVKFIKESNECKLNIPDLSMNELMDVANKNGLENDDQTRSFCKFISIGTNFASMNFVQRFQNIPDLIVSICDLIETMENEIKEFAEIANYFSNLIKSFIKLVMNTKHNMKMVQPHLEESILHLKIMSEALMPESENALTDNDLKDIDLALTSMSSGIVKLINHARSSKEESVQLDLRINKLKYDIETKVTVTENRINFGNLFKLTFELANLIIIFLLSLLLKKGRILPKIGASLGMISGATAVGGAVESVAFGGAGALVLGGLTFPPLGAILIGAAIGAVSIGSVLFLIIRLWQSHQFKAIGYLNAILDKLNKLNSSNLVFMDYMHKSEEESNKILTNIEFLKRNVGTGSLRYRQTNAAICNKAIESTNDMIKCIKRIDQININDWISNRGQHLETSEECNL
jgi:hypothetical protein